MNVVNVARLISGTLIFLDTKKKLPVVIMYDTNNDTISSIVDNCGRQYYIGTYYEHTDGKGNYILSPFGEKAAKVIIKYSIPKEQRQ